MPEAPTALLLLGNRSPYGLSIAGAVLESRLPLRAVVVPSPRAWERVRARSTGAAEKDAWMRRAGRRLRRALDRGAAQEIPGGEPVRAPDLDPGLTEAQLAERCRQAGVGWHEVDDVRSEPFLALAREADAGVFLSAAFPLLLPQRVLGVPARGGINFHPSLLPRCRGSHPIYWTLASGEAQGGVSAHVMTHEVDAGDLVAQIALPLSEEDDYGALYRRAMAASPQLVANVETFLRDGGAVRAQDGARATFFREDRELDHEIRWRDQSAREVVALVRAGEAFTWLRGQRLGIVKALPARARTGEARPGRVLAVEADALEVGAREGSVALQSLVWRGRAYGAGRLVEALGVRSGEVLG